jgi:PAS domain S-box-containing protein
MHDLGHTADGLFVVDPLQRIVLWNAGAEKLTGRRAGEVTGKRCFEVVAGRTWSGKIRCRPGCPVQRMVRAHRTPVNFDLRLKLSEGAACVNVSILGLYRRGRPYTVHLVRDATLQERYRQALLAIRKALAAAEHPGADHRDDGRPHVPAPEHPEAGALSCLTGREVEILSLVAAGFSNAVIARRLGISAFTVRNHMQNALQKLKLHTRAQAVSYAFRHGFV